MKAQPCKLIINTANGYCTTPIDFPSLRKAVEYGRNACGFAWRIFVNGKVVKRGFCE